jgi:hypothetical protein
MYYPIVVAVLTLLNQGNLIHVIILKHLVDFHEIWYGGNAIQGDLYAIMFIPIVSTALKWFRFKFQMKVN